MAAAGCVGGMGRMGWSPGAAAGALSQSLLLSLGRCDGIYRIQKENAKGQGEHEGYADLQQQIGIASRQQAWLLRRRQAWRG